MGPSALISILDQNHEFFGLLLGSFSKDQQVWRPAPEKWCALEIACHLHDEEIEDFRTRTKHVMENPENAPPKIDPVGWVKSREYMIQDYEKVVFGFLNERKTSITWLNQVASEDIQRSNPFSENRNRTAVFYLSNWVAHDYLHIKQLTKLKYDYLQAHSEAEIKYAGKWK